MSMRVIHALGYEFVQNMTTFALWVYKDRVCVSTAYLNGPLDRRTMLEILKHIKGGLK